MEQDETTREVETSTARTNDGIAQRETIRETRTLSGRTVAQQIVWYVVGVVTILLALRLILQLLGANQGNAFVDFIYSLSAVFAAPFFGMFSYTPTYGASYFEVSTVVAILIYMLVGWLVAKLFTLGKAE